MSNYTQPRELKLNERDLLDFLLSADFPGNDQLREQLKRAEVVGDCDCGCGTIDLSVRPPFVAANSHEPIPVEAHRAGIDVLLFVRDGRLSSLEIVDYENNRPLTYPSPNKLELWVPPGKSNDLK
jgi:hypothetical protein